ncbi:hypothetical protein COEX109129_39715 [Corallococcus exiguus]
MRTVPRKAWQWVVSQRARPGWRVSAWRSLCAATRARATRASPLSVTSSAATTPAVYCTRVVRKTKSEPRRALRALGVVGTPGGGRYGGGADQVKTPA